MSIGLLIAGALISWVVLAFVLFGKLSDKIGFGKAHITVAVIAIAIGIAFGYLGGTRLSEGEYSNQRCYVCRENVESGYKLNKMFSTYYCCEEHKDFAYELAGLAPSKSNRLEDTYGHDEFDAVAAAEKIVKSNLKSPSTAEFCKHKEYTITCSGDTWTIKGYVDAQNSFGATLRNNFTVKITFTSSTKYTIDLCSIN